LAVANYHQEEGHFPPAYLAGPDGRPWHSWRVLILPYMDNAALYAEYEFSEPWDGPRNPLLAERMPDVFAFAGFDGEGNTTTNFLAVVGPETAWPAPATVRLEDVTDDPSRTILVVENLGAGVHWMEPRDLKFADLDFTLNAPGGIGSVYDRPAVVTVDDAVRQLDDAISPETLRALLTVAGGEAVEETAERQWRLLPDGRNRPLREH
jgi:hypothetical protein